MNFLTWQSPGQYFIAQGLIKNINECAAELREYMIGGEVLVSMSCQSGRRCGRCRPCGFFVS